jgi:hypothetical protein
MAPDDSERDVLSSLPRTRPQRRSAKRDAKPKPAPKAKAKPAARAKPRPRKAPAKAPASLGAQRAKRGAKTARRMPPSGFAPPRETRDQGPPSGTELVGTAIQAAAELAQIGLAVGGHALRSALGRRSKS